MPRNIPEASRPDLSNLNLSDKWNRDWLNCALDIVWQAYDKLMQSYKDKGKNAKTEIENQITSDLILEAQDVKYDVLEGFSAAEFRKIKFQNQPPDKRKSNDFGVFFGNDDKAVFIFEAKKIDSLTDKAKGIKSYIEDLKAYLNEYYISHLPESALIAYLHTGTSDKMFELIEKILKTKLKKYTYFANRPHKTSEHKKTSSTSIQPNFLCHHLIFEMQ